MLKNPNFIKNEIVSWIRKWFEKNGQGCTAVVGISGGKDSSVVAALCVEALGRDRVYGVLMPNGEQSDIDCSKKLVAHLGIRSSVINIGNPVKELFWELGNFTVSDMVKINTPARMRMVTLYAVAACMNGRVANTCNLSENTVSYSTKYGDSAGDFSPLENLTVTEVKQIGYELGLPIDLIEKVPSDGLCGKTDEDNFGFTYEVLDRYIRTGVCEDKEVQKKIEKMRESGLHKLRVMDSFHFDTTNDTV